MISIEKLTFLQDEVLVLKQKSKTATDKDAFHSADNSTDKDSLVLATVVKVGKEQIKIKVGDEILMHELPGQTIKIKGQGVMENTFKVNPNHIYAVVCR